VAQAALAQPADLDAALPADTSLVPALLKAAGLLVVLLAAALLLRRSGIAMLHAVPATPQGALLLVGAGGAMMAAGLPRQVLALTGGYGCGAPAGMAVALLGQMLGALLDYGAARFLAAGLVQRLLARPSARRTYRFLAAHPFTATLTLRLLPVGSNVTLNVLAGASHLRAVPFFAASLLGFLPQTIVFALLGSGTQVGKGTQLVLGMALFAAASAGGFVLYRRTRRG
jgi:uncharacterized membrane protein YdjX (TVP38/TMEM64 family)